VVATGTDNGMGRDYFDGALSKSRRLTLVFFTATGRCRCWVRPYLAVSAITSGSLRIEQTGDRDDAGSCGV